MQVEGRTYHHIINAESSYKDYCKNRNDIVLINTDSNLGGSGGFELGVKNVPDDISSHELGPLIFRLWRYNPESIYLEGLFRNLYVKRYYWIILFFGRTSFEIFILVE